MQYIYKFIEYINEKNILSIGLLVLAMLFLMYLYTNKEEVENYLGLKLVGFYLLGSFTFNFDIDSFTLIIPVGFIIYLVFMKNKERTNSIIKKKASILGLIILCLGILNSIIYDKVEYRDREIHIKNISIKSLSNDYEIIKKELGIDDISGVESFELKYNKNDSISSLNYTIQAFNNRTYYISGSNDSYSIKMRKSYDTEEETVIFSSMGYNMEIEKLLDVISNTKFKKYKNSPYYTVIYRNEEGYYEDDDSLYTVDLNNYSTEKLNSKYPIDNAVYISHIPMRQLSEGSWESIKTDTYLMSYEIDENQEE